MRPLSKQPVPFPIRVLFPFCLFCFCLLFLSACAGVHYLNDLEGPTDITTTTDGKNVLFTADSPQTCDEAKVKMNRIKNYIISLDEHGQYDPLSFALEGCDWTIKQQDQFSAHSHDIVHGIFSGQEPNRKKLLIFIHGGLNTFESRTTRAVLHSYLISHYHLSNGDQYYPLFINWPSGLFDTYGQQIFHIRQGDEARRAPFTFPFYFLADVGQALARLPGTWEKSISRTVGTKFGGIPEDCDPHGTYAPETILCDKPTERSFEVKAERVARFLPTYPFRLLFSLPVDSFGKTAWVNMLRRTRTILRHPRELMYDADDPYKLVVQDTFNGTGDLATFFNELSETLKTHPDYTITIIGHSMGTIIFNEIVRAFPDLPYENIVYMAAACSIQDFERSVVPVLADKTRKINFFSLSLDPDAEAREYTVGGIGPTGSLLEWIEEYYTDPPTVLDRTLGKWRNIAVAKHMFPKSALEHMTFKVFRWEEGKYPTRHGEFDEYTFCYWDPVFWKTLKAYEKCKYNPHHPANQKKGTDA